MDLPGQGLDGVITGAFMPTCTRQYCPNTGIPFVSIGDKNNPPVVFIHGFMGSAEDWLPIVQHISCDYYYILIDLPGHGFNTSISIAEKLSIDSIADQISSFIKAQAIEHPVLVGYSLGGRCALATAGKYSGLVKALILEGTNPGISDPVERDNRVRWDQSNANLLREHGMLAFLTYWYNLPIFSTINKNQNLLEKVKRNRSNNSPHWMAKIVEELSPGLQPSMWTHLRTVSHLPALLIHGELDLKYKLINSDMKKTLPEAVLSEIPDAGHNTHLEYPESFIRIIEDFLNNLPG